MKIRKNFRVVIPILFALLIFSFSPQNAALEELKSPKVTINLQSVEQFVKAKIEEDNLLIMSFFEDSFGKTPVKLKTLPSWWFTTYLVDAKILHGSQSYQTWDNIKGWLSETPAGTRTEIVEVLIDVQYHWQEDPEKLAKDDIDFEIKVTTRFFLISPESGRENMNNTLTGTLRHKRPCWK